MQRHILKSLDPNAISIYTEGIMDKSSANNLPCLQVDREEYLKVCRERDTLTDEVRKLTRELSKLSEPEQSSNWQKITASTRELRRMEDTIKDLKTQLDIEKVYTIDSYHNKSY